MIEERNDAGRRRDIGLQKVAGEIEHFQVGVIERLHCLDPARIIGLDNLIGMKRLALIARKLLFELVVSLDGRVEPERGFVVRLDRREDRVGCAARRAGSGNYKGSCSSENGAPIRDSSEGSLRHGLNPCCGLGLIGCC
jgi:hypothetical protein